MLYAEQRTSLYVRCWQVLTWCVALAVLIPWSSIVEGLQRPKPVLTNEQVVATEQFITDKVAAAQALGTEYTCGEYAVDRAELGALHLQLGGVSGPQPAKMVFERKTQSAVEWLCRAAKENEAQRLRESAVTSAELSMVEYRVRRAMNDAINDNYAYERSYRAEWLPAVAHRPFNWSGAARRFSHAWLLSLIPAFAGIAWRFRERKHSLVAELLLRPWVFVAAGVFWWYGLYQYPGYAGAVELRFERLKRRFAAEHDRWPDEQEAAALLQRASGSLLSFEAALLRVQAVPELMQVKSRRAIFVATLVSTLTAPFQFVGLVSSAVAQTVTTAASCSTTVIPTSTDQRRDRGTLWGYAQFQAAEDGFALAQARLKGSQPTSFGHVVADVDLRAGRLRSLAGTIQLAANVDVSAGLITTPGAYDYDPPQRVWFASTPLYSAMPELNDFGVMATAHVGAFRWDLGAVNGEGRYASNDDGRIAVTARNVATVGPVSGSLAWQSYGSGYEHYRSARLVATTSAGTVALHAARRDAPRVEVAHLQLMMPFHSVHAGVQLEHPRGCSVVLEKIVEGWNRISLHWRFAPHAPPRVECRFQYAFDLSPVVP